jgi:hypothetical protein
MGIKEGKKNTMHPGSSGGRKDRVIRLTLPGGESLEALKSASALVQPDSIKSEIDVEERRKVLIFKTGITIIALVVFAGWAFSLKSNISKIRSGSEKEGFGEISEDIKEGIKNIAEETEKLKQLKATLETASSTIGAPQSSSIAIEEGARNGASTSSRIAEGDALLAASTTSATGTAEGIDYKEIKRRIKLLEEAASGTPSGG